MEEPEPIRKQDALLFFNEATREIDIDQMGRYAAFSDAFEAIEAGAHPETWKAWVLKVAHDCGGQSVRRPSGLLRTLVKRKEGPSDEELRKPPKAQGTKQEHRYADEVLKAQRENMASCPCGPPMEAGQEAYRRGVLHGGIEGGLQAARDVYDDWADQGHPAPADYTPPWKRETA